MKSKKKKRQRKINRRRQGLRIEKLACEELKRQKYLVWKPVRVRFHSQDIFGVFDVIAISKKELKLIQVQAKRKRPYKTKKIVQLPKPKKVSFELWIFQPKKKQFQIFTSG